MGLNHKFIEYFAHQSLNWVSCQEVQQNSLVFISEISLQFLCHDLKYLLPETQKKATIRHPRSSFVKIFYLRIQSRKLL